MGFRRDPVSELFDHAARTLLRRAYRNRGQWTHTRLSRPTLEQIAWAAGQGINLLGRDNAATAGGGHVDYRNRWCRGFARAIFHQNDWYYSRGRLGAQKRLTRNRATAIEIRIGPGRPQLGVIPAGWPVDIKVHPGGSRARAAAAAMPASRRIFDQAGNPAGHSGDPERRDW